MDTDQQKLQQVRVGEPSRLVSTTPAGMQQHLGSLDTASGPNAAARESSDDAKSDNDRVSSSDSDESEPQMTEAQKAEATRALADAKKCFEACIDLLERENEIYRTLGWRCDHSKRIVSLLTEIADALPAEETREQLPPCPSFAQVHKCAVSLGWEAIEAIRSKYQFFSPAGPIDLVSFLYAAYWELLGGSSVKYEHRVVLGPLLQLSHEKMLVEGREAGDDDDELHWGFREQEGPKLYWTKTYKGWEEDVVEAEAGKFLRLMAIEAAVECDEPYATKFCAAVAVFFKFQDMLIQFMVERHTEYPKVMEDEKTVPPRLAAEVSAWPITLGQTE